MALQFDTVVTDTASAFSTSTGFYTVLVAGTYQVTTKLRMADGIQAGISYGQGPDTSNEDSSQFEWNCTFPIGQNNTSRSGSLNTRTMTLNKGDQVRLVIFLRPRQPGHAAARWSLPLS